MEQNINLVKLSYGRCAASPGFFDDFYHLFFNSSPLVKERFRNTDMRKQKELLRHGLSHLIMYAGGSKAAKMKVDHLAESHNREHLDIHPWMYDTWVKALLKTVKHHDKKATDETLLLWEETLQYGIDRMISAHVA